MHGLATFTIMAYFCEYDVGEIIVPMLLMEVSTTLNTNSEGTHVSSLSYYAMPHQYIYIYTYIICRYPPSICAL
jgi:hypothetical protein